MENRTRLSNALQANRIPELLSAGYDPVLTRDGTPRMAFGSTANVACVQDHFGENWALRVAGEFGTGVYWARHYQSMQEDLPDFVRKYFPRTILPLVSGITLVGRKMPTVLMEWIEGPTLTQAIGRAASSGNGAVLEAIAMALRDLSIGLRDSRVTHGDITPDNLMLRASGDLVCVDLDTLEWPGARKRMHDSESHAYRHPRRSGTPAHQDAFAILVLSVSTLLLCDAPHLLQELGPTESAPDNPLLFAPSDLRNIRHAHAMVTARRVSSVRAQALLDVLQQACESEAFRAQQLLDEAFDIAHVPTMPDAHVFHVEAPIQKPTMADEQLDINATIVRLRDLYGQPTSAPSRARTPYVETWPDVSQPAQIAIPEREILPVEPAPDSLPSAVVKRPLQRLIRRNAPDIAKALEEEANAARRIDAQIAALARKQDDPAIIQIAEDAESRGLVLEESTRTSIRRAQDRATIRSRLNAALAVNDRRELADIAVSGQLALLGDTSREALVSVLQALHWPTLLRAIETDDDQLILQWFDEEIFGDPHTLPQPMRLRIDLARTRLQWLGEVRASLKSRDAGELELLVSNEPVNGRQQLSESERRRVRQLIDGKHALSELDRSLRAGDMSRVIAALELVQQTDTEIDDESTLRAVRRIVDRTTLIDATITAARQNPPDDRMLATLIPQLRERGVSHDVALRGEYSLDRLEHMVLRGAVLRRIRLGIRQNDDRAIRLAAYPDATGAVALLTPEERRRVEAARATKRVKRMDD